MTMDIVEEMRRFEIDHEPDGWPAVKMRKISALCDEIDRLRELERRVKKRCAEAVPGWAPELRELLTPNV